MRTTLLLCSLPLWTVSCVGSGNQNARLTADSRHVLQSAPSGLSRDSVRRYMGGPPQEVQTIPTTEGAIEEWHFQYERFVPLFTLITGGWFGEEYALTFRFDSQGRLLSWSETSTEVDEAEEPPPQPERPQPWNAPPISGDPNRFMNAHHANWSSPPNAGAIH